MRHPTSQQAFFISILLLMIYFATGRDNADSTYHDPPNQSGLTDTQAGGEQRQQVTLRIAGMS